MAGESRTGGKDEQLKFTVPARGEERGWDPSTLQQWQMGKDTPLLGSKRQTLNNTLRLLNLEPLAFPLVLSPMN